MADQLNKTLQKLVQRTSGNTGKLKTEEERAAFSNNVKADLAVIINQLNSVYYTLTKTLMSESNLNALDYGLSGNVIKTHIAADKASASAYFDTGLSRAKTVKETIDVLLTELARLENLIVQNTSNEFDSTELEEELAAIRTFIGMMDVDSTPLYSEFGALNNIEDSDSLVEAVWKLDQAITPGTSLPDYTSGAVLFGDETNVPDTDPNFVYDSTNGRLAIGTSVPEVELDIRGTIQHEGGVISRGGNTRGVGASDLQITRSVDTQVASGDGAFVAGENNTGSGENSFAAGLSNTASGPASTALGQNSTADSPGALAVGSSANALAGNSFATGENVYAKGYASTATGIFSETTLWSQKAHASGCFDHAGDAQVSEVIVRRETVGVGPFELFLDGTSSRIILTSNTSYGVVADVISRDNTGQTCHYILEGTIKKDAAPGTTALIGAVTQRIIAEQVVANDATIVADAVNDALVIQVTGGLIGTTRWCAHVKLTNVWYA